MTIFGETCERCGQDRADKAFEGVPTCDDCLAEIAAEREETRHCPIDGTEMEKIIHYNVVLDRCPTCGGHWFDHGELTLLQVAVAKAGQGFAERFVAEMLVL